MDKKQKNSEEVMKHYRDKSSKNKHKMSKKDIVTASLLGAGVLTAIGLGAKMIYNVVDMSNNNQRDFPNRLGTVQNVNFDENNYILSWNNVEHADGYKININGKEYKSSENELYYVPNTKTTTFKVKATDSTNMYVDSYWSTECNYTIPDNQTSLASVNTFVNGMIDIYNVEKVVSMHAEDNKLYTTAVFDNGRVYQMRNDYDHEITSLSEVINNSDYGTSSYIIDSYEAKDYNSANYYLRSDTYKGDLEDYKEQGYTFDVVTSQAYRIDKNMMGFDSVFKLTSGSDVKYVANRIECYISDTANDSVKYTNALVNIDSNVVRLRYCVELSGDFVDYANILGNSNQNISTSTVQYTYDAEMSY